MNNILLVIGICLIIKVVILLLTWEYIGAWLIIIKEIYE
jgi:hypothetical protein